MVYFITSSDSVKIGFATSVRSRLAGLQVANPNRLELALSLQGTKELEDAMHEKFALCHIRGDWFKLEGVADYIKELKAVKGNLSLLSNIERDEEGIPVIYRTTINSPTDPCIYCGLRHKASISTYHKDPKSVCKVLTRFSSEQWSSLHERLIKDLQCVIRTKSVSDNFVTLATLCKELPWVEDAIKDNRLTAPEKIVSLLLCYNLKTSKGRIDNRVEGSRGYYLTQFTKIRQLVHSLLRR